MIRKQVPQYEVFILITERFDEEAAIHCFCQMRAKGLSTELVGLTSGLLGGLHGLNVRPGFSLTEIEPVVITNDSCRLLIISGGQECTRALLTDPRVHRLIETTFEIGGITAVMTTSMPPVLNELRTPLESADSRLLIQGGTGIAEFVELLIKRISV